MDARNLPAEELNERRREAVRLRLTGMTVAAVSAGRVRDRSIQLRQRSVALWLAVVYHETRQSPDAGLQAVHREVLGILRELRDARPLTTSESAWFKAAA